VLTADLVEARPRGGQLRLSRLDARRTEAAIALAQQVLAMYAACLGQTREALDAAIDELIVPAKERRLYLGLVKLVEDTSTFEGGSGNKEPSLLRRALFTRAAAARKAGEFDRPQLLATIAAEEGLTPEQLERDLYGDLRGAEILGAVTPETPEKLVERWSTSQVQAVLLRATRIVVDVEAADPADQRALFRKLKFLRLLWRLEKLGDTWRITIDGPLSLFDSVTKYGLELAMIVPLLDGMRAYKLACDLKWGKTKVPLTFEHQGGGGAARSPEASLPDDIRTLFEKLPATGWTPTIAHEIIEIPGLGLIVPDLLLEKDGKRVFVEVLGHWSREAVWKRVELVEAGMKTPIVFAVSERLRVSEEVLPGDAPACLYVYKGVMSARAIAERAVVIGASLLP